MSDALLGRTVVIIGGTGGLGLSATRACLGEGARVAALGLDDAELTDDEKAPSDNCRVLIGDARRPDASERAIETALDAFGGFDALYHVAGGSGRKQGDGPLHEVTDDGIDHTLQWNLHSVIYSNRAAVKVFLARKTPGVILNMGSVLGSSPSPRYFASHAYAAAKASIVGFSKSCAAYYAPHSIRFNVVAPGLVDTAMAARAMDDQLIMDFVQRKQPLDGGRVGRPEDLDAAVVYLLSDHSRFVTGQVLGVDGGWSVSEGLQP